MHTQAFSLPCSQPPSFPSMCPPLQGTAAVIEMQDIVCTHRGNKLNP